MSGRRRRGDNPSGGSNQGHSGYKLYLERNYNISTLTTFTNILNDFPEAFRQALDPSLLPQLFGHANQPNMIAQPGQPLVSATIQRPEILSLKMFSQIPSANREPLDEGIRGIARSTAQRLHGGMDERLMVKTLYCNLDKMEAAKRLQEGR